MNVGTILRVAGTILLGVAFVLVWFTHGNLHAELMFGFGGGTLLGTGTLV